ncbi:MAG TPA: PAS domain-containing protein, partial [Candidatus Methylacidiphilales bacterium]
EWRQVRIFPYRTTENVIDGLVITFIDINRLKKAEEAIQRSRLYAENIVATIREPLIVLYKDLRVVSVNRSFIRSFKIPAGKIEGQVIYEVNRGQWAIPRLRKLLENILPKNTTLENFEVSHTFAGLGARTLSINARRLAGDLPSSEMILLAIENKTKAALPVRKNSTSGKNPTRKKRRR